LTLATCGSGDESYEPPQRGQLNDQTELFARRYAYLVRGDKDFPTLTRFRAKKKPIDDGVSRVMLTPDPDYPTDGDDSCKIFQLTLQRDASVKVVVADSIGAGMVSFEYDSLAAGEYTIGSGSHPEELAEWTRECKRLVISIVVDMQIRHRARWSVSPDGRLVHRLDF
jgi:hypothetical protein